MIRLLSRSGQSKPVIIALLGVLGVMGMTTALLSRPAAAIAQPATVSRTECAVPWIVQLNTSELNKPKPYLDNTNAAYATFYFSPEANTHLYLSGSFPAAEFMSFETNGDHIFDYEMQPLPSATNPFVTGANISAMNTAFLLELRTQGSEPSIANSLQFSTDSMQMMVLRIYAPDQIHPVITLDDLPKVFAVGTNALSPAKCPAFLPVPNGPIAERFLSEGMSKPYGSGSSDSVMRFRWIAQSSGAGINQATYYLGNNNAVQKGDVAMIRLKNPRFANSHSGRGTKPPDLEVRGWVICVGDTQTFYTIGCIPDWSAKTDTNGYVTVVVGNSTAAQQAAEKTGANFLWDTRPQKDFQGNAITSMSFHLRNILPNCQFAQTNMYTGDYCPTGIVCSASDYLAGKCVLPTQGDCSIDKPTAIVCTG